MKPIVRWNLDPIDKRGASINLIYGERSNGKSYQVKHKKGVLNFLNDTPGYFCSYKDKNKIIEKCIKKHSRFMLVRRLKDEISSDKVEQYFTDVDVIKLTNGEYNCFTLFKKKIYLANYDVESGKTIKGEHIGYVVALSTEQSYAGASYLDVTDIIFEEFMSRSVYLANEPDKLMNLYSTVDRKRGVVRLWLVGNSISRVCPYLEDWGLQDIIKNLKQGEIAEKWISTGSYDDEGVLIEVKIAIEYCKDTGQSSFIIGKHKNMLNKGEWQSDPQPHLPKSLKDYKKLFQIGFQYQSFKFLADYLMDKQTSDVVWFVYPYNKEFKNDLIVFSDTIKSTIYYQRDIYMSSIPNDRINRILKTFKENRIFYANDLCGTDFKQCIDFEIKK